MDFYDLIMACESANTQADMHTLLLEHKDNDTIKELFRLMLDKSIIYNIKAVPDTTLGTPTYLYDDTHLLDEITVLLNKDLRGDNLKEAIQSIYSGSSMALGYVLEWILDRQNPARIGKSFVNKVWPGLIRVQPYMGAVPGTEEALARLPWKTGVNVQHKEDGMTLIFHYTNGFAKEIRTRAGQDVTKYFPKLLSRQRFLVGFNGFVHHEGFVLNPDDGLPYDRQTGNGLINKAVKNGTIGGTVDDSIHSVLLDMYSETQPDMRQWLRYDALKHFKSNYTKRVSQVMFYSLSEARKWAQVRIRIGSEGVICKDPARPCKDGKPWFNVKIKNEFTVELIAAAAKPHSKNPDWIGAVLCESQDGILQVWVTPKNDADKALDFFTYWKGTILSVKAESITKSKGKKKPSLYLGRFDGNKFEEYARRDKVKADTYQEIKEQETASKEIQ